MMKRKLFGISATLAVLLAFGLVLASCGDDDGGGGGKTVTFTLEASGDKAFTLAVSGAKWTKNDGTLLTESMDSSEFEDTASRIIQIDLSEVLTWTFTEATQTLTATAENDLTTGSVTFVESIYGPAVTDGDFDDTYVGTPAEGITFGG